MKKILIDEIDSTFNWIFNGNYQCHAHTFLVNYFYISIIIIIIIIREIKRFNHNCVSTVTYLKRKNL